MDTVAAVRIGVEEIADLGLWLRDRGLLVDTRQLIAAAKLLESVPTLPPAHALGDWLSPVFSSCASDQDRFVSLYAEWLSHHPHRVSGDTSDLSFPPPDPPDPPKPRLWRRIALMLVAALFIAALALWVFKSPDGNEGAPATPPAVIDPPAPTLGLLSERVMLLPAPAPVRGPDLPARRESRVNWATVALCAGLMLSAAAWWLSARLRRRGFLERLPADDDHSTRQLTTSSLPALSAYGGDLRYLSREMRRRRRIPSRTLDVAATMAATLKAVGLPMPVFGTRVESEYLALVDRAGKSDHLARIADEVLAMMLAQGVSLERYEFDSDPHFCYHAPLNQRALHKGPCSPDRLAVRHPGAIVFFISDGAGLLDRYTGQAAPWLRELSAARPVQVLTPLPRAMWTRREWVLGQAGVSMLPLDAGGLHMLGDMYREDRPLPPVPDGAADRLPPAYQRDSDGLLGGFSPHARVLDQLLGQLQHDLGPDGYAWLAGCAVFPEIHWSITLAVGDAVLSQQDGSGVRRSERYASLLTRLSCLPWLRQGYMPDWLRSILLNDLPAPMEARIRACLAALLENVADGGSTPSGDVLHIALERPRSIWSDVWTGLKALGRPVRLARPREDRIFLRFMSGPRPRLAVGAAAWLATLFYRHGLALAGPRLVPVALAAGLALGAALQWPPLVDVVEHVPGPVTLPVPEFVTLDQTGARVIAANTAGSVDIMEMQRGQARTRSCQLGRARVLIPQAHSTAFVPADPLFNYFSVGSDCPSRDEPAAFLLLTPKAKDAERAWGSTSTWMTDDLGLCHSLRGAGRPRQTVRVLSDEVIKPGGGQAVLTAFTEQYMHTSLLDRNAAVTACAVSGNGNLLVVATTDRELRYFTLPGSTQPARRRVRLPAGAPITALATDWDGAHVAAIQAQQRLWLLAPGASSWTAAAATANARAPLAWSADGETLAFANARREVEVWKLKQASKLPGKITKQPAKAADPPVKAPDLPANTPEPPLKGAEPAYAGERRVGWAYLGHYIAIESRWETRYIDFPATATPASLQGASLRVRRETGNLNVRSGMPTQTAEFPPIDAILKPGNVVKVRRVMEWYDRGFIWAEVDY